MAIITTESLFTLVARARKVGHSSPDHYKFGVREQVTYLVQTDIE